MIGTRGSKVGWFKSASFFSLGLIFGWMLKTLDNVDPIDTRSRVPDNVETRPEADFPPTRLVNTFPTPIEDKHLQAVEAKERQKEPESRQQYGLKELLDQRKYEQAISLFQSAESRSETDFKKLKTILLDHLNLLLKQDRANDFIELTNLYLTAYFEDIDVLMLLAEFNKDADLYIEAVGIYQLATEYAYSLKSQKKIEQEFDDFMRETDSFLSQKEDWYNLSQIFLQAEIVGLLKPKYRLRQAEIYLINGERYEALQILNALLGDNNFSKDAKALLDRLDGGIDSVQHDSLSQNHSSAVALEKRGNQYIADLGLGETSEVRLLIDTGASLTTLSQDSFSRIQGSVRHTYVGDRMFSTANGLVKGEVYSVDVVSLANYSLENTVIAVLDFGMGGDIDGLLGMNVLGKFRFQIDQDKNQLLLSPR